MSWGTELWDQYDSIATHTQKGIDFLERYGNFVDQRSKIEQEYATKLRRLIKTFQPKKKDEGDNTFTYTRAYKNLLDELGDQAGQHEMVAENISTTVVNELMTLVKQLKDDRRKHLAEGARISQLLQSSLNSLSKTQEKYEKAFGASERALDSYQKADLDLDLSRAELEKHRINLNIKNQQCEDAKNEYANQLQKTNEVQKRYYNESLPSVFDNLQDVDEQRIKCVQNFITKSAKCELEVIPIVSQCLEGTVQSANAIDEKEDSKLVIERYKSGFSHPEEFVFEDLSVSGGEKGAENVSIHNGSLPSIQPLSSEKRTILGTITGGRVKKRSGILSLFTNNKGSLNNLSEKEDFSELPPNQRRKKLQAKIDEITSKVCQETAARDGLMKMKQVYEANPALGDPMSIQGQLTDNGQRLDKLRAELKKYQTYLDESEGRISTSPAIRQVPLNRRSSISDETESLSRSASDSSVANPTQNHNKPMGTPLHSHGSSNSPESGLGMSSMSLPSSDQDGSSAGGGPVNVDEDYDEDDSEFYDSEPLPALGKCRALYTFEVTSEGSIRMEEGEDLWIIEHDQGDGWTRVRRTLITTTDPMPEGFVPSSYIEICETFPVPHPV